MKGRILARFSNDIFAVDVVIPALWDVLVMCVFAVRTQFFLIIFFVKCLLQSLFEVV